MKLLLNWTYWLVLMFYHFIYVYTWYKECACNFPHHKGTQCTSSQTTSEISFRIFRMKLAQTDCSMPSGEENMREALPDFRSEINSHPQISTCAQLEVCLILKVMFMNEHWKRQYYELIRHGAIWYTFVYIIHTFNMLDIHLAIFDDDGTWDTMCRPTFNLVPHECFQRADDNGLMFGDSHVVSSTTIGTCFSDLCFKVYGVLKCSKEHIRHNE